MALTPERASEFGKLGGRPLGEKRKYSEMTKEYIAEQLYLNIVPIVKSLMRQAKQGNVVAFTALMDRAYGKPITPLEHSGTDGQPIVFLPLALIQKHALQIEQEVLQSEVVDVTKDVVTQKDGSV